MPRQRYIQDPVTLKLVPAEEYYASQQDVAAPFVMADIQPYQSMATGEMITGRRQHREHLKSHGLVELGNEIPKPRPVQRTDVRKEQIARIVYDKLRY